MGVSVAIDCMGGDHGPHVTVPAALEFVRSNPSARVILVGREDKLHRQLSSQGASHAERVPVRHAAEVVEMHDSAAVALRNKKDSSMRVAIDLVKSGEAQAAVSAGNTGALMAISRFVLKTLPGIDRPAILSVLPALKGKTYVLDLGANVDCEPEHLLQFAVMGATLVAAVDHKERPTVGLLNIGEESIKGNEVVKQAAKLLRASGLNFQGNVEGGDLFSGKTDVVVCDGFVGNVALKSTEGVARMLAAFLREEFRRNWFNQLAALVALPALSSFKRRVDPRQYNGASLLGLRGLVVKSHGSADSYAFQRAIEQATREVETEVLQKLAQRLTPAAATT